MITRSAELQVIDWDSLEVIDRHPATEFAPGSLCFSPDGKRLAWATQRDELHMIEIGAERWQLSLDGGDVQVRSVAFDPSGDVVAIAGRDGVTLIDTGARREIGRLPHPAIVQTALYRNADEIATSCQDGALRVWSIKDRKVVREVRPGEAVLRNLCLSRDGRLAAVRGFRRLFVIELDSMRTVASLAQRGEYGYVALLGNDRTLLAWFDDQEGWIWNSESWQAMGELSVLRPLSHVRASADGFRLVTTGEELSLVDATPPAPPPRAAGNTAAN